MRTLLINLLTFLATSHAICQELSNKTFTIDHLYIRCENNKEIEAILKNKGFTTYKEITHKGQGTKGSYILFENMYIEFLSVYDQESFNKNNEVNNLKNGERIPSPSKETINPNSPFGLLFTLNNYSDLELDFETITYKQEWMKPEAYILMAKTNNTYLNEPAIMILSESMKFESGKLAQYLNHPNKSKMVTSIEVVSTKGENWSPALVEIKSIPDLNIIDGEENLMIITLDHHSRKKNLDLRPQIPLILKY